MGSDSDDESMPLSKVSRKSSASDSNQRSTRPRRNAAVIARTQMFESEGKGDLISKSRGEKRRDSKSKFQKQTKSKSIKQNVSTDDSSSSGDESDDKRKGGNAVKKKEEEEENNEEDDDDDDDDEQVEDPNKLYCICRKPYNKEYLVCFHFTYFENYSSIIADATDVYLICKLHLLCIGSWFAVTLVMNGITENVCMWPNVRAVFGIRKI